MPAGLPRVDSQRPTRIRRPPLSGLGLATAGGQRGSASPGTAARDYAAWISRPSGPNTRLGPACLAVYRLMGLSGMGQRTPAALTSG